jgi:hypothetical protein
MENGSYSFRGFDKPLTPIASCEPQKTQFPYSIELDLLD